MIKRLSLILPLLLCAVLAGRAQDADTLYVEEPDTLPRSIGAFLRSIDWPRQCTSVGLGLAINYGLGAGIKAWIKEERPDHSDLNSFPSRHSSTAFSLCYTVGNFMGPYSPWWLYGAHTVANGVGFQRVMAARHWPSDVMAGAGIGMGINMFSDVITNWIFGKDLNFPRWHRNPNTFSGGMTISTSISMPLQRRFGGYRLGSALVSNLRATFPLGPTYGLCGGAQLLSGMVKDGDRRAPLTSVAVLAGGTGHWHNGPYGLSAYVMGGYRRNIKCEDVDFGRNAPVLNAGAQGTIMLTRKLSVGAEAGYGFTTLRLGDCSRGVSSIYVGFLTRAFF